MVLYREIPAYCPLILGPYSPPALKLSDPKNDMELGVLFVGISQQHFQFPQIPLFEEKLFYSIEIVDLFLSLSYIYHQQLKDDIFDIHKTKVRATIFRGQEIYRS